MSNNRKKDSKKLQNTNLINENLGKDRSKKLSKSELQQLEAYRAYIAERNRALDEDIEKYRKKLQLDVSIKNDKLSKGNKSSYLYSDDKKIDLEDVADHKMPHEISIDKKDTSLNKGTVREDKPPYRPRNQSLTMSSDPIMDKLSEEISDSAR